MFQESAALLPSLWASLNSWFTPTVFFVLLNLMIATIAISSSFATRKHQDQYQHQHHSQDHLNANPHPYQLSRYPSMLQRLKSINFYSYRTPEPATSFHIPQESAAPPQQHYAFQEQIPPSQEGRPQNLTRAPSMLQRLKSISFSHYLFPEPSSALQHSFSSSRKNRAADTHYDSSPASEDTGDDDLQVEANEEHDQSMDEIYSRLKSGQVNRCNSDTKPASGDIPPKLSSKMKKSASTKSAFSHFKEKDIVESRRPATAREANVSTLTEADEEVDAKADDFINRFKQQLKLQRLDSIMRYKNMISRGTVN